MAKLKTLSKRIASLPARLASTADIQTNYGQGRGGRPWRRKVEQIKVRDQYTCRHCGVVTVVGSCDHITPRAEGGTDADSNLQWLCNPCHDTKTKAEAARGIRRD